MKQISLYNLRHMQLHQIFLKSQTYQMPHQNCSPRIDYKHYFRWREQIPSVNASPSIYQTEKHQNMKMISFYTLRDCWKNTSQTQTRSSWPLSYLKLGNTQLLVEVHDKPGHQGATHTYCLIKCQYYWKGMNKDIRKYTANCTLCHRETDKVQSYPLLITEIPEQTLGEIAIDLVTECETSTSGNKHIVTIIDHLKGWMVAFPILDKSADTIVSTFISQYLTVHMCPRYILSDNSIELKNQLMDQVLQQLGTDCIFSVPY